MIYKLNGESIDDQSDIFVDVDGFEYGAWARGAHSEGDLITHPASVIESLLRDWKHSERDLQSNPSGGVPTTLEVPDLKSTKDDYYNGAYLHAPEDDASDTISDYEGSTNTVTLATGLSMSADENCFVTNVNCNINEASFDAVESNMANWVFTRSINERISSEDLLNEALFEAHCILIPSYNEYKLIQIASGTEVATLGDPLKRGGGYDIKCQLSSPLNLYNKYRIEYAFDHAKGEYLGETFVNKNGSSDATNLGSTYKSACDNVEKNYKVDREFRHQCKWISDETTAEYFTQKMVEWHTTQKLRIIGKWAIGDTDGGSTAPPIRLEVGDLVKVNTSRIPTALNNSTIFMIDGKTINPYYNFVSLSMTEMV